MTADTPTRVPQRSGIRAEVRRRVPLRVMPQAPPQRLANTWRQASPRRIAASLADAQSRPTGGWRVAGASTELGADTSLLRTVHGRELVLWRDVDGSLRAGDGACPHLGAALDGCDVVDGAVLCRWHGMALGSRTSPRWATVDAHDDGVLLWVRAGANDGSEAGPSRPVLPTRPDPDASLVSVISLPASCEPRDIIANRLDPWHGAWLHPYAFSDLEVLESRSSVDRLVIRVAYRLGPTLAVPVVADFTCPDSHSIVMTILEGEGAGSVVETHATAVTAPGDHPAKTVMTEAVVATSQRVGFRVARLLGPVVRVGMRASARQLWADDLVYAERRYALRRRDPDRWDR